MPRSRASRRCRSRSRPSFRMPIIRLIEGSGGGGSVKTIETTGRANLPGGLSETDLVRLCVANQMAHVPVVGARPRFGRRARRGATGAPALFGDGEGNRGGVRRRAAGGGTARRAAHQAGTGRLGDPDSRCGAVDDAVDTEDEAFAAARRFLSYMPSSIHDAAAAGRRLGRSGPARRVAARRHPARAQAAPTTCAGSSRAWWTRTVSSRWAAGSAARSSPDSRAWTAGRWR